MKVRYDFVTNSSSTSFVIISDGEFNLKDFIDSVGVNPESEFVDIYQSLFESFKSSMVPIRERYDEEAYKYDSFENFILENLWKSGEEVLPKIIEAEKNGKQVYLGSLSSDQNETECFFCTDDFIIETEKLYIDAQENGW